MPDSTDDHSAAPLPDAAQDVGPCHGRPAALWFTPVISVASVAPRISASAIEVATADAFGTAAEAASPRRRRRRAAGSSFSPETGDMRFA